LHIGLLYGVKVSVTQ